MPNEIRVMPSARSCASTPGVIVSGLASTVTSAPGTRPNSPSMTRSRPPSWPGGSSVGVPPPKNTVRTGTSADPSTWRANRTSAAAWPG